jgi:hypothetical protein
MDELQETVDTLIDLDEPEALLSTLRKAAKRRKGRRWEALASVLDEADWKLDMILNAKPAGPDFTQPDHSSPPANRATGNSQHKAPVDPQDAKLEAHVKERPAFVPKPALDPHAERPPEGAYADGMTSAQEQRARSAWIEEKGMKAYHEAVDDRSDEDKAKKQVPGVTPPTKRE